MYQPAAFQVDDAAALRTLIEAFPLATLVHTGADQVPVANVVPLQWQADGSPHGVLVGHVARANPLWQEAPDQTMLCLFHGPQAYVSPGWYPSKAQAGKAVPTWNYALVQVHGRLQAVDDPVQARVVLDALTRQHERDRTPPWSIDEAPPDYLEAMLRAVVVIRIVIERMQGKFKLSQNRSESDHAAVAQALSTLGQAASLADLMRAYPPRR